MARRRLQSYATPDITVTFDPARCIHAAECVRRLPEVFDTARPRWIRPERASVNDLAATIEACPTGALQYRRTDGIAEAVADVAEIRVSKSGPLYLRGPVRVTLESGEVINTGTRVALCRCGTSRTQPFCDGSHTRIAVREAVTPSGSDAPA